MAEVTVDVTEGAVGEARRISSGPAYDVQPGFSPDGRWIAFASDAGSGLLMIAVAGLAGFLPARRASRVDPMLALKCE